MTVKVPAYALFNLVEIGFVDQFAWVRALSRKYTLDSFQDRRRIHKSENVKRKKYVRVPDRHSPFFKSYGNFLNFYNFDVKLSNKNLRVLWLI